MVTSRSYPRPRTSARFERRLPLFSSVALFAVFFGLFSLPYDVVFAQGGAPANFLLRGDSPSEAAASGTLNTWSPSPALVFRNGAALTRLDRIGFFFAASSLPAPQSASQFGVATNLGSAGGVGLGISSYGVDNIDRRFANGERKGMASSSDLAVVLSGGLKIGPGSIGGSLRYVRYDLSGEDASSWGATMDLSGTLAFEERLIFALEVNNVAGSMNASYADRLPVQIPPDARFGATYVLPLEERDTVERIDPSGHPSVRSLRPRTYVLATGDIRVGEETYDAPILGLAIEAVPALIAPNAGVGFRTGFNSRGDIAFGLFVDAPIDIGEQPRLSFGSRRDYDRGEFSMHFGLEFHL